MKMRLMYGESFVTYCGFDDYVVDLDNFPELQGKTGGEVSKWAFENSKNLSVDEDYSDSNPRQGQGPAMEIVPFDEGLASLKESLGAKGMNFSKVKGEECYMLHIRVEEAD
jgi:hypothetical protein